MNKEILYIELKTGFSHNGPAWIGVIEFSKSKQTVYFDGKALKKFKSPGINANYYDIEKMADIMKSDYYEFLERIELYKWVNKKSDIELRPEDNKMFINFELKRLN